MKPVTREHRLAILEAWNKGGQILSYEYEWAEKGSEQCPGYPRYDELAQLLANGETSDLDRLIAIFSRLKVPLEQWSELPATFLRIKIGGPHWIGGYSPKPFMPEITITFTFKDNKAVDLSFGVSK